MTGRRVCIMLCTDRNRPLHAMDINILTDGAWTLMYFVIEIKVNIYSSIIIESSICAVGVLPEGLMSGKGLCQDDIMRGGGFVRRDLSRIRVLICKTSIGYI